MGIRNQRGNALIQSALATVLMAVTLTAWMSQMDTINKMNQKQNLVETARLFQEDIRAAVLDPKAWQNTLNDPANLSMDCLRFHRDCVGQSGGMLRVHSGSTAAVIVDTHNPSAGFTSEGAPCTSYPDKRCLLRATVTWEPLCPTDKDCSRPTIQIVAEFSMKQDIPGFNPDRYRLELIKRSEPEMDQENFMREPASEKKAASGARSEARRD